MERDKKLLPCPFCGGSNVTTYGPYGWHQQWCISHSCKAFYTGAQEAFKDYLSEAEAIAAWNTRPTQSAGDVVEAARDAFVTLTYLAGGADCGNVAQKAAKEAADAIEAALSPTTAQDRGASLIGEELDAETMRLRAAICQIVEARDEEDFEALIAAIDEARDEAVISALRSSTLSPTDAQGDRT